MGLFDLFKVDETQKENRKKESEVGRTADTELAAEDAGHLDLRAEELDIDKHRVDTGDVTLKKNIVEEEQSVNVPFYHDQVVIEQKAVDHEPTDEPITEEETVHIPVTAEKVDVGKHTVVTGEVTAHKHPVQETEQVNEVLRKEVADIDSNGSADVTTEG